MRKVVNIQNYQNKETDSNYKKFMIPAKKEIIDITKEINMKLYAEELEKKDKENAEKRIIEEEKEEVLEYQEQLKEQMRIQYNIQKQIEEEEKLKGSFTLRKVFGILFLGYYVVPRIFGFIYYAYILPYIN